MLIYFSQNVLPQFNYKHFSLCKLVNPINASLNALNSSPPAPTCHVGLPTFIDNDDSSDQ